MFQPLPCTVVLRRRNAAQRTILWLLVQLGFSVAVCLTALAQNPTPGQNVNMVSGFTWPYGDPFLERQNEPSLAVSTRNALHLLGGANDYRTVDLNLQESEPGEVNTCPPGTVPCPGTAEPWVGQYISTDGGARWQSTLLPGYPQDASLQGMHSPLHGFTTASDPVVRAGTNGIFYYAGIAFNRGTNNGLVFVARFMDLNNKENGNIAADSFPIRYIDTNVVARGSSTQFLDKPWIAVDVARSGRSCNLSVPQGNGNVAQTIPAGNVYVAYANIANTNGVLTSTIYFSRSVDCGVTWSTPIALSHGYALSQGTTIQIDPQTGIVYVVWRTFQSANQSKEHIVVAVSLNGGQSFFPGLPVVTLPAFNSATPTAPAFFDQGTTQTSFRSAAYPAMAVQDSGIPFLPGPVYFAWSQRGAGPNGEARIMMLAIPGNAMITPTGIVLPTPFPVDNGPITDDSAQPFDRGHQYGPSMTFIEGKLMLIYYDQRLDHTLGSDQPSVANGFFVPDPTTGKFYTETRQLEGELASSTPNYAAVFTPYINDADPPLTLRRHTIDVTLAQSDGGLGIPTFTFTRVSRYDFGLFFNDPQTTLHQLKVNPPGLPMFEKGTVPFMGDYIDIVGQTFVPKANGGWAFNSHHVNKSSPVHYAAWTSNQDVIPPMNGDWTQYFPITSGTSVFNRTATPPCQPGTGFEGDRNQNVYQSRITQGLLVSSPQDSKPLSTTVQRAFVILSQNFTNLAKNFRLTIANQPPGNFAISGQTTAGGFASFQQALPNQPNLPNPLPAPVTQQNVAIAAHSGAALTVFALSSNPTAGILVNVNEVDQNGNTLSGGLSSFILLNADGTVPTLTNPDGAPQSTNITGVEIYDPGISGPGISGANANAMTITSPGISGPGISGTNCGAPGISGPGISGSGCTSPGISGPGISGPGISGPGISGMTVVSPGISGTNVPAPGISGSAVSDATYSVSNNGNTTASYNVPLIGCDASPCKGTPLQLVMSQIYLTPGTDGQCNLIPVQQDITLSNNAHPVFTPASQLPGPGISGSAVSDAQFSLEPGDTAFITIRGFVDTVTMQTIVTQVAPAVIPQAIDTNSTAATPTFVAPLFVTTAALPDAVNGSPYNSQNGASLQAIGGKPPYNWNIAFGVLPPGLTLNASTGAITGAPDTTAGTFLFTAQVTDSAENAATRQFSIRVANPLAITTTTLPAGATALPYNDTLNATGGFGTLTWNLTTGSLPPGVTLTAAGVLSGTPTASGTFTFTVTLTDSSTPQQTAASAFSIVVGAVASANLTFVQQPTQTAGGQGISPAVTVRVTDNTGAVVGSVVVAVAIGNNPAGGTLSGSTTATTDEGGIATFATLSIDRGGVGYTLVASLPAIACCSVVPATSIGFNVVGFSSTGGLTTGRWTHTATLLGTGKVLVAGGLDATGSSLASTELYDPVTGTFAVAGTMNAARSLHTATSLSDGRVLVAGGGVASAELYNPTTGVFTITGSMSKARFGHTATLLNDGTVLITGGSGDGTAEIFNPTNGTFTATANNMTAARRYHTATLLGNGQVLLAGGEDSSVSNIPTLSSAEIYDPAKQTFTATNGGLATSRELQTATVVGGTVYIIGGRTGSSAGYVFLNSAEVFDPIALTFGVANATLITARTTHTATLLPNGSVLLCGGFGSGGSQSSAELFSAFPPSFIGTGSLVTARYLHTATLLGNGTVLIIGGLNGATASTVLSSAEIYHPAPPPIG